MTYWDRVAGAYDRIFSLFRWTDRQLAISAGLDGRILEVCCGTAHLTCALLKRGLDVYGIDLSPAMIAKARRKLTQAGFDPARLAVADVTRLPFAGQQFDYVLVTGALGLLPRVVQQGAIQDMARVCRQELRLLEPLEKKPGFYLGRLLTFMADGMRPVPRAVLNDLQLQYTVEWDTMLGIFSYVRASKK